MALGGREIHALKGLARNQKILDHMGSKELFANLSRTTLAKVEISKTGLLRHGAEKVTQIHYEAGVEVRDSIIAAGGTRPEDLPAAKSIIQLAKEYR